MKNWSTMKKLMLLRGVSASSAIEDVATGNPVVFQTDLSKALKRLAISFLPVQSGSGDPSPQNIRPIVAWDGVKVWNGGKNLISAEIEQGAYDVSTGSKTNSTTRVRTDEKIALVKGKYTISAVGVGQCRMLYYNGNYYVSSSGYVNLPYTFTLDANMNINVMFRKSTNNEEITPSDVYNVQIEVGETASAYEPYKPITEADISFPSPVYGGYVDLVSGEVWATWVAKPISNIAWYSSSQSANGVFGSSDDFRPLRSLKSPVNIISDEYKTVESSISISAMPDLSVKGHLTSKYQIYLRNSEYTTREEFLQYARSSNVVICYEIDSPQLITTLTPQQITAIKGNNTIWSDANGNLDVTFLRKG